MAYNLPLTGDGYCTREIKIRISMAKEAFNRENIALDKQIKHLTHEKIRTTLFRCYVWKHCFMWFRDLDTKIIGAEVFGELRNVVLEENGEDKMVKEISNEKFLESIGEKRTLLNSIMRRKVNWYGHILRINCLLHDAVEGQMTEVKELGRRTQILEDLRNRRRYWELKEEDEDRNR